MGFSTHDPACDHCRAKKIRCDRDEPKCGACRRDDTACDFSDRGKRINQTKLLYVAFRDTHFDPESPLLSLAVAEHYRDTDIKKTCVVSVMSASWKSV